MADPGATRQPDSRPGCLVRVRRLVVVALAVYALLGILTTLVFVFVGPGNVGTRAFGEPQTYLICLLWPLALWEYVRIMLGLG